MDTQLFTSGQIPVDQKTEEVVEGGITEHAHQVMKNLQAVLKEGKLDYQNILTYKKKRVSLSLK